MSAPSSKTSPQSLVQRESSFHCQLQLLRGACNVALFWLHFCHCRAICDMICCCSGHKYRLHIGRRLWNQHNLRHREEFSTALTKAFPAAPTGEVVASKLRLNKQHLGIIATCCWLAVQSRARTCATSTGSVTRM